MVLSSSVYGQLNDYKYIIVPKKFDAYKTENKHQTSTMIKHLFAQKGFNAVYDDELPEDLSRDRCLGLLVNLEDNSSMFSTKTVLVMRDCTSNEIFRTLEGRSKVKDYRAAYSEAIEKSFGSFDGLQYKYEPRKNIEVTEKPITVSFKNDVKSLDEASKPKMVVQEATPENQSFKSMEPKSSNFKKAETKMNESFTSELLYAQPIENGYQLVDSAPKVRMKLIETSIENVFLIDYKGISGVVLKKENRWFLEYLEGGTKKIEELNIKF
ncbi:hypothetical protein HME9304_00815 [Flagellimonas maritima]|uniref:Uncharacterized protein n=2 Tax=Flagellimonas maritima TaxID=1383885 RepID=A0A2Z4LQI4_9FLAO|nr:hypothetical protein HME9304_00815 [Allomuricauda aurantiaca]